MENAQVNHVTPSAVAAMDEVPNQNIDFGGPEVEQRIMEDARVVRLNVGSGWLRVSFSAGVTLTRRMPNLEPTGQPPVSIARVQKHADQQLLTYAAVGLTIAIVVLLVRKFIKSSDLAGYTDGL
uniref:Ubiquitin-conjugating enzyme E2 32 n=1 Tax=Anthurium amnicola TaxID=1678845 RepID=A0A1D1Z6T1_9ARAE